MKEYQSRLQVLHRYLSPRIWQSEIVIAESLHLPNLNLENALRLGMHAHRNNIIGSTSIIAVKEKTLVCHCGSCAARIDVWEGISVFRAPQRLNKPTGGWHSKPVSGAATFLRLEPEDSPALNAYPDRGLESYAN